MIDYFEHAPILVPPTRPMASAEPLLDLGRSFTEVLPPSEGSASNVSRTEAVIPPPQPHSAAFITGITVDKLRPLHDQAGQLLATDGEPAQVNGDRAFVSRTAYVYRPPMENVPAQRVRLGYLWPANLKTPNTAEPHLIFTPAAAEDSFPHLITSNRNYFGAMAFQVLPGRTILYGIGGAEFSGDNPADIAAATEIIDGLQAAYDTRTQLEAAEATAAEQLLQAETRSLIDTEKAARQLRRETAQIKRRRRLDRVEGWLDRIALDLEPAATTDVRSVSDLFENSVVVEHSSRNYQSLHAAATANTGLIAKTKELQDKRWLLTGALLSAITVGALLDGNGLESYQEMQPRAAAVGALLCGAAYEGTIDHQTFRAELCQRSAAFEVTTTLALAPHGTAELPVDQVIADTAYTRAVPHHFSAHPTDKIITHGLSRYTVAAGTTNRTAKTTGDCAYTGYIGGNFRKGQAIAFGVDPDTHAKLTVVNDHDLRICVADANVQTTVFIDQK